MVEKSIFFACCLLVGISVIFDTLATSSTLWQATNLKLSDVDASAIHPSSRERKVVIPVTGIDGKWWVIHTEQMLREGGFRVRITHGDNSPAGREVHWSSGPMWILAGIAWIFHGLTNRPVLDCVSLGAMYGGPVQFGILLLVFALVLAKRFGWVIGALGLLILGTCFPVFELFRAGNFDHHGLVGWFGMMSVLCIAAGGAGCVTKKVIHKKSPYEHPGILLCHKDATSWFVASGIFGAAGLWVSAATMVPMLAGIGVGGLSAAWLCRKEVEFRLAPDLWKTWAIAGCLVSLFFYCLEYFPNHMGWRLEVNHPLYSLAWLGSGFLLCALAERFSGKSFPSHRAKAWVVAGVALVFLAAPALFIYLKSESVFWVSDSFLLALHNEHIGEFQPFLKAIEGPAMGIIIFQTMGLPVVALLAIGFLLIGKRCPREWVPPLTVAAIPPVIMLGLGMKQIRWVGIGLFTVVLFLVLVAAMGLTRKPVAVFKKWQIAVLASLLVLSMGFLPLISIKRFVESQASPEKIPKDLLPNVVARDVCQRILRANPERLPVLLSGPTTSTDIAFYGGIPVIGTLYWENMPGLKAAASIFSSQSAELAMKEIKERGITHILLFSWDEFSKDYHNLYARQNHQDVQGGELFVSSLIEGKEVPDGLRPLYYPIPHAFGLEEERVWLFEVVPSQSPSKALFHRAIFALDSGNTRSAIELLERAKALDPGDQDIVELLDSLRQKSPWKESP